MTIIYLVQLSSISHYILMEPQTQENLQMRQTEDAKLSSSGGGNGLFTQLSGRRSFILFYTYSTAASASWNSTISITSSYRQSPFITPLSPANHVTSPIDYIFLLHLLCFLLFSLILMFLSRALPMPIPSLFLTSCCL